MYIFIPCMQHISRVLLFCRWIFVSVFFLFIVVVLYIFTSVAQCFSLLFFFFGWFVRVCVRICLCVYCTRTSKLDAQCAKRPKHWAHKFQSARIIERVLCWTISDTNRITEIPQPSSIPYNVLYVLCCTHIFSCCLLHYFVASHKMIIRHCLPSGFATVEWSKIEKNGNFQRNCNFTINHPKSIASFFSNTQFLVIFQLTHTFNTPLCVRCVLFGVCIHIVGVLCVQ